MTELHALPAWRQSELLAAGEITSVEITRAYAQRIETLNEQVHAFITPTIDAAMLQAKQADQEIRAGKRRGPLHGLPVALKDAYDTAGIRTTVCSKLHESRIPDRDAFCWSRLRDAGTILLGKLECTEFCLGGPANDGLVPHSRNPWDPARYAGGSSSGAGVGLAARMIGLTLGSDTGGSIRIPAAFCGVSGHKPTYGLVSLRGLFPLSGSLDHAGPLATCSADCALLLDAIAAHDPLDPTSVRASAPNAFEQLSNDLRGIRIGYVANFSELDAVNEQSRLSTLAAIEVMRSLGAEVEHVQLADLWDYTICNTTIMLSEAYAIHEPDLQQRAADYTAFTRSRISLGSMIHASDYLQAQKLRRALVDQKRRTMESFDVLIYPGMLGDPPFVDQIDPFYFLDAPLITAPANVTGVPAASVCTGYSDTGMPQAIQITGRWFDDATVLRVAHAYEMATGITQHIAPSIQ